MQSGRSSSCLIGIKGKDFSFGTLSSLGNTQDNHLESLRKTQVPCRYMAAFAKQKDLVAQKSIDIWVWNP